MPRNNEGVDFYGTFMESQSPLIWMGFVTFVPFCRKMLAQHFFFLNLWHENFQPFLHIPMFLSTRWSSISKSKRRCANEINVKFVVLKQKCLFLPKNSIDKWQPLFFGGYGICPSLIRKISTIFTHSYVFVGSHMSHLKIKYEMCKWNQCKIWSP